MTPLAGHVGTVALYSLLPYRPYLLSKHSVDCVYVAEDVILVHVASLYDSYVYK
jgi:hypothetical protein